MSNLDFWLPIALLGFIGAVCIVAALRIACVWVEK